MSPLPSTSLQSLEGEKVVEATIIAIDDTVSVPLKKDLRFITVECAHPSDAELSALVKLSQYVESFSASSAILHTKDIFEFEVQNIVNLRARSNI